MSGTPTEAAESQTDRKSHLSMIRLGRAPGRSFLSREATLGAIPIAHALARRYNRHNCTRFGHDEKPIATEELEGREALRGVPDRATGGAQGSS